MDWGEWDNPRQAYNATLIFICNSYTARDFHLWSPLWTPNKGVRGLRYEVQGSGAESLKFRRLGFTDVGATRHVVLPSEGSLQSGRLS